MALRKQIQGDDLDDLARGGTRIILRLDDQRIRLRQGGGVIAVRLSDRYHLEKADLVAVELAADKMAALSVGRQISSKRHAQER